MINPAIETDLVGELVRVDECGDYRHGGAWRTVARGRIRAVTAANDGDIRLWIEVHDEECQRFTRQGDCAIGDVIVCTISGSHRINLVRSKA